MHMDRSASANVISGVDYCSCDVLGRVSVTGPSCDAQGWVHTTPLPLKPFPKPCFVMILTEGMDRTGEEGGDGALKI